MEERGKRLCDNGNGCVDVMDDANVSNASPDVEKKESEANNNDISNKGGRGEKSLQPKAIQNLQPLLRSG